MPVFKNEDNSTWYVMARYVNWKGKHEKHLSILEFKQQAALMVC